MAQFTDVQRTWVNQFLQLHTGGGPGPLPGPTGGTAQNVPKAKNPPPTKSSPATIDDLIEAIGDNDDAKARQIIAEFVAQKKLLSDRGANDVTPLTKAVKMQNGAIAQLLLDNGAHIDAPGAFDQTALYIAVEIVILDRKTQMRDLILNANPSVDLPDADGKTPLMVAARGDLDTVKLLVKKKAGVNKESGNKDTPLSIATAAGEDKIVEYLLGEGADPTRINDDMEQNALMTAAWNKGTPRIAAMLLDPKAKIQIDVNKQDKYKRTALFLASKESNSGFIKELIKHPKIDVNKPADDDVTPFIVAAKYADAATVTALLSSGKVQVNATTKNNKRTALMEAAFSNRPADVYQALLAAKPALDSTDQDGNSALMLAVKAESVEAVKALLGANAKQDIKNGGQTALDLAIALLGPTHAVTKLLQPASKPTAPQPTSP